MKSYAVETRGGCLLVRGNDLMGFFRTMRTGAMKGFVIDTDAARMAGADLATGRPADLAALKAELAPEARGRIRLLFPDVPEAAREWLATGERGLSAEAMFRAALGAVPDGARNPGTEHPRDPADFRRCRLLEEAVPDVAGAMAAISALSPEWAALARAWGELRATMDAEAPEWRSGLGTSPLTYALIQKLA